MVAPGSQRPLSSRFALFGCWGWEPGLRGGSAHMPPPSCTASTPLPSQWRSSGLLLRLRCSHTPCGHLQGGHNPGPLPTPLLYTHCTAQCGDTWSPEGKPHPGTQPLSPPLPWHQVKPRPCLCGLTVPEPGDMGLASDPQLRLLPPPLLFALLGLTPGWAGGQASALSPACPGISVLMAPHCTDRVLPVPRLWHWARFCPS